MKNYGEEPTIIGEFLAHPKEMMFYQDMPIKMAGQKAISIEPRLQCFRPIIAFASVDYMKSYGVNTHYDNYMYLSAKYLFQGENMCYNRPGWHCDGFMSDDVNYVWSDCCPTIFNIFPFNLTQDDVKSMKEMEDQANPANNKTYPDCTLLRLDQYNVHRVGEIHEAGMRAFIKVTFSKDKYDLEGNAHNYLLDYQWEMKKRTLSRNIPQSEK